MENNDEFRGLLIDKDNKKSNGVLIFENDGLILEKRSRLNGRLKESLNVSYDDIPLDGINRIKFNKLEFNLNGEIYSIKTIDYEELDILEKKFSNKIQGLPDIDENAEIPSHVPKADIPDQIRKYHELYKDGIISEEEFESKKKELLNS